MLSGISTQMAALQNMQHVRNMMAQQAALANMQGISYPPMDKPGNILDESPEAKDQRQTRDDDKQEYYRRKI